MLEYSHFIVQFLLYALAAIRVENKYTMPHCNLYLGTIPLAAETCSNQSCVSVQCATVSSYSQSIVYKRCVIRACLLSHKYCYFMYKVRWIVTLYKCCNARWYVNVYVYKTVYIVISIDMFCIPEPPYAGVTLDPQHNSLYDVFVVCIFKKP